MLLSSTEFRDNLQSSLGGANHEVLVLSGFIKAEALRWLLAQCGTNNISVVSRWRKHDLICGASDFECYEICKQAGVRFGVSQNLHGKVYNIDQKIFVGSANLTSRGMAFSNNYNDEFGIGFNAGESDKRKVQNYLNSVVWLDDTLAKKIEVELEQTPKDQSISELKWSSYLDGHLQCLIKYIWMHELLFCKPDDLLAFSAKNEHHIHDFELLGLDIDNINRSSLTAAFVNTNCFKWLDRALYEEKSMSFGRVSKLLHDAILDDPVPYRRDVKMLVSNLYAWFELSNKHQISRPNYSQVIELLE